MVEHTGHGDPGRSLALLWRTSTKTGRSGLSLDAIVEAGITVARQSGIGALSMRRLADRLGVGTMSLYAHVPGKAELLDLMVDHVNAAVYADAPALGTDWREALTEVAERNWRLLADHRWLLGIDDARPPLGPGTIAKYDTELSALEGIGLDDVDMDRVLTLVLQHVRSTARLSLATAETAQASGQSDEQWWSVAGPVLEAVLDPDRFPLASRIGTAAGEEYDAAIDVEGAYAFGLRTILDGIEALLVQRGEH